MIGLRARRARPPRPVPAGSAAIEVRGLGVDRGARTVPAGVDLTVRAGEVVALVGPNGAGKSTLLGAIGGDVACTGEITVDGAPLTAWSHAELAMRRATLLLDEPTAALDLHHQEMVFDVVRERAAGGAAVVVVVHDLGLAAAHADRVAVLAEGRLAACGPPGDVLTAALLSEVYRHDVEVLPHPRTGRPLILPHRPARD